MKKPEHPERLRNDNRLRGYVRLLCAVVALSLACAGRAGFGQARESGNEDHPSLWVGAGASLYRLQYGAQNLVGPTGYFDADSARRLGIEGEGRWLEYRQFANVHTESYLIGPRYHLDINRFEPYVKGLVGFGKFNFPYNYARGTYLMVAGGGGVDFRLSYRWSVRVADLEYQAWPQFTFGSMTSWGISSGIRYKLF